MISKKIFLQAMAYIGGLYGEIKPESIDVYRNHLKDLTEDDLRLSVKRIVEEYRYKSFPSVADIRYYAGKDLESISYEAISKLKKISRKKSDVYSIQFTDRTLNAVSERYAKWSDITNWTDQDWNFNFKKMQEMYSAFKRQGIEEDHIVGADESRGMKYRMISIAEQGMKMKISADIEPLRLENK